MAITVLSIHHSKSMNFSNKRLFLRGIGSFVTIFYVKHSFTSSLKSLTVFEFVSYFARFQVYKMNLRLGILALKSTAKVSLVCVIHTSQPQIFFQTGSRQGQSTLNLRHEYIHFFPNEKSNL